MSRTDFSDHVKMSAGTILKRLSPEKFEGAMKQLNDLAGIVGEVEGGIQAARASGTYTQRGLEERSRELKATAAKKLEEWEGGHSGLNDNIRQHEAKLVQPHRDTDLTSYWRELELRNRLYTVPELERARLYSAAARSGLDPLLERATENAPILFPLVGAEVLEAGRTARAERHNPEVAASLKELRLMRKEFDYYLSGAKKRLNAEPDVVREAAEGRPPAK